MDEKYLDTMRHHILKSITFEEDGAYYLDYSNINALIKKIYLDGAKAQLEECKRKVGWLMEYCEDSECIAIGKAIAALDAAAIKEEA